MTDAEDVAAGERDRRFVLSGRTARAGKTGISISLINLKEVGKIRRIEKVIGKPFTKMEVPKADAVVEKQLFALIGKVNDVDVNDSHIDPYLPRIMDSLGELSKEDIIKRFASLEFNRFFGILPERTRPQC